MGMVRPIEADIVRIGDRRIGTNRGDCPAKDSRPWIVPMLELRWVRRLSVPMLCARIAQLSDRCQTRQRTSMLAR